MGADEAVLTGGFVGPLAGRGCQEEGEGMRIEDDPLRLGGDNDKFDRLDKRIAELEADLSKFITQDNAKLIRIRELEKMVTDGVVEGGSTEYLLNKRIAELEARLEKARQDVNWMLNNRQFLNPDVFDYLDQPLGGDDA